MAEFKFPTEEVKLPSKGLLYPEGHPLASGVVNIKYMTAKEEDILTNQNYIAKGTVLDKLLESVIVDDVKLDDFLIGDKNAVLIATRILGYGKEYKFSYRGEEQEIDLTTLDNKEFDENIIERGRNEFPFTLPSTGTQITYKLLTGADEKKVDREVLGLQKLNKNSSPELSTRLKHTITSVEGDDDTKTIREFVDNQLLARDSRALREHIRVSQPDVDLNVVLDSGEEVKVPIGLNFFWPDL